MFFIASKLVWGLLAPGNFLALTGLLGLVLQRWRPGHRIGRWCITVAVLGFAGLAILPVGDWLMAPLENRFPRPVLPDHVDGILVLGGAVNPEYSKALEQVQVNEAGDRLLAFAALARRYPQARLIYSGGAGLLLNQEDREATYARHLFDAVGLPETRVIYEAESRNTYENAVFSRQLAGSASGDTWVLVTSASHMPRAIGIFRALGWPMIAYPVDFRTVPAAGIRPRLDLSWGLDLATDALREWIGLVSYRLAGRTDALFPGPD